MQTISLKKLKCICDSSEAQNAWKRSLTNAYIKAKTPFVSSRKCHRLSTALPLPAKVIYPSQACMGHGLDRNAEMQTGQTTRSSGVGSPCTFPPKPLTRHLLASPLKHLPSPPDSMENSELHNEQSRPKTGPNIPT